MYWELLNRPHWVGSAGMNIRHWAIGIEVGVQKGWATLSISFGPFWASLEWFRDE